MGEEMIIRIILKDGPDGNSLSSFWADLIFKIEDRSSTFIMHHPSPLGDSETHGPRRSEARRPFPWWPIIRPSNGWAIAGYISDNMQKR